MRYYNQNRKKYVEPKIYSSNESIIIAAVNENNDEATVCLSMLNDEAEKFAQDILEKVAENRRLKDEVSK